MAADEVGEAPQDDGEERPRTANLWEVLGSGLVVGIGLLIFTYGIYATFRVRSLLDAMRTELGLDGMGPSQNQDLQAYFYTTQALTVAALGLGVAGIGFIWRRLAT